MFLGTGTHGDYPTVSSILLESAMRSPRRLMLLTFLLLILSGVILLSLPGVSESGTALGWIDTLFTSTSAVCVTGLIVTDTGTTFTFLGQAIILFLIQAGGLGILTLSNWLFLTLFRQSRTLRVRIVMEETHGAIKDIEPIQLLRNIIRFTFVSELIGAGLLFLRFRRDHELMDAIWSAVFHSVSAFCNAGFSLYPDSMMGYRDDWLVNLTVMGLIVTGGIGFIVCTDLTSVFKEMPRRHRTRPIIAWQRLSLHSKTVLTTTSILLVSGTVAVLLLEGHNQLAGMPWHKRLLPSLFLSVTSRTAGFNTLETGELTNVTLLMLVLFMMIGASPGSTGGGMKTTTFAIFLAMGYSRMRNRNRVEMFGRTIPEDLAAKAITTMVAFLGLIVAGTILLEYIQFGSASHSVVPGRLMDFGFEVVSALGTVGLSVGATSVLEPAAKVVLAILMFAGRVGPLVVASTLIGRRKRLPYSYPEERVMVG